MTVLTGSGWVCLRKHIHPWTAVFHVCCCYRFLTSTPLLDAPRLCWLLPRSICPGTATVNTFIIKIEINLASYIVFLKDKDVNSSGICRPNMTGSVKFVSPAYAPASFHPPSSSISCMRDSLKSHSEEMSVLKMENTGPSSHERHQGSLKMSWCSLHKPLLLHHRQSKGKSCNYGRTNLSPVCIISALKLLKSDFHMDKLKTHLSWQDKRKLF